jgi:hypothetical protein
MRWPKTTLAAVKPTCPRRDDVPKARTGMIVCTVYNVAEKRAVARYSCWRTRRITAIWTLLNEPWQQR